ncbi:MAG: DUF6498-containing protein [Arenicella sp.]
MKFPNNRIAFFFGLFPAKDKVDYLHIMPFIRHKGLLITFVTALAILIAIAVNTAVTFGVTDGVQVEGGLFRFVGFIFTLFWLIGWCLAIIIITFIFLVLLLGQAALLVYNGKLEVRFGIPLMSLGIRLAASEVISLRLTEVEEKSIFPKEGQALSIDTGDDNNSPLGGNFTLENLGRLKAALAINKNIDAKLDPLVDKKEQGVQQQLKSGQDASESKSSLWMLIVVNLIPLLGAYFFNWQLDEIMVLYWSETLILLLFQSVRNIIISPVAGLLLSVFNSVQIMGFMAIHFLFIWVLFVQGVQSSSLKLDESLTTVVNYLVALWPAFLGLFISHGYSLFIHFFKASHANQAKLTVKPLFSRVIVMHIALIVGGFFVAITQNHWLALPLLIILKIIADAKAHSKQHGLDLWN